MKKKWWSSLRIKIVAWSFVPAVIILSAVAWFTFYSYQQVLVDLAIKQYPDIVLPKTLKFYGGIGQLLNTTTVAVFLNIDMNHEIPLENRAEKILEQAPGLEIFDGGIYFLDQQGKVFKSQPPQSELIGQDWSDTPHFRSINETPNMSATTDLIPIKSSGKKIFCSATAMSGKTWKDVVGAFYVCFTVYPATQNAYYQKIKSLDLGSDLFVVDRNQQVVYSPDLSEMGKDLSGEAYLQQLSQGENRSGRFRIGNEDVVVSYTPIFGQPINRIGWHVLTKDGWAHIMQPSLSYRQLLFAMLALGVIVPALVTAYGVRHITGPIQKLIHAAEQVTAGQFKHRIAVNTGDEIETLANQFNRMSAELDESYGSLEKKVADRTRQLAIMNAITSVASHSLDIQEILGDALNTTVEQLGFDAGAAFRFEADPASILLMAQRSLDPDVALDLAQRYASTGQRLPVYPREVTIINIEDFQDETLKDDVSQLGFQRLVYVPLSTKGRELGFFILGKREAVEPSLDGKPSHEELALLSSIGKQIGVAMENAHLYEQAEQTAILSERNRLARELHDAVTQTLFSASLIADVTPQLWKRNPAEGLQQLDELRQLTRGALAEMRTLLLEMRPEALARADIKSLLTQLADAFIGRARVPLDLQICGDCALPQDVKVVFYRVAQEALNNIAKHSGARHVALRLDGQPRHSHLCIQDDGLGFDPSSIPPGHLGVSIMRERAGSIAAHLMIESQPGQGTTVTLDWGPAEKEGTDEHF